MNLSRWIGPIVGLLIVVGAGAAAFATKNQWWEQVFPDSTSKPEGGHDHGAAEKDAHAGHDHGSAGDRVKLSAQAQKNLNLDVDLVEPQVYWRKLHIPGVVVDSPGESDRSVSSRMAGVVTKIHAKPGDTIRAGEALFTLQLVSETVQATQRELATAAKELMIVTENRDRIAAKVEEKVVPAVSLIEPENLVKRANTLVRGLRRQLMAFGLTSAQADLAESGEFVTEVTLFAPGEPKLAKVVYELQELKANLGDTVQAGQVLSVLANHQKLYVEGQAFKSEALALAKLAEQKTPVEVEFSDEATGDWPVQAPLLVHHLSNVVDPNTRTFGFFLPLENVPRVYERDGKSNFVWRYRPGQRVRLKVPVEKLGDDVLVLPASAVCREGAEAFAFVQNGDLFVRKPVRVLYQDRTDVVLANDGSLPSGAFVVKNQANVLNRALKAAAGEGGGGHDHDH
jgi:cobalt-zinc-cadmium efflux system membrane fusion protein